MFVDNEAKRRYQISKLLELAGVSQVERRIAASIITPALTDIMTPGVPGVVFQTTDQKKYATEEAAMAAQAIIDAGARQAPPSINNVLHQ